MTHLKMRLLCIIFVTVIVGTQQLWGRRWIADNELGLPFEQSTITHRSDGAISTIVRLQPERSVEMKGTIVYVHGFNDYFFQSEEAERFVDQGYAFYAVDLRNYGRSIRPGDRLFNVDNFAKYFADIDSAITVAQKETGKNIILMGHSTGGLSTSLYLATTGDPRVRALILNSPFLDWNLSPLLDNLAVPIVSTIAPLFPNMKIKQGGSTRYADSLLKRWKFNTGLKLRQSPDVTAAWIKAVNDAQLKLHSLVRPIGQPILLMHSDKSRNKRNEKATYDNSDTVLDVTEISKYGRMLGCNVTEMIVKDGIHDLFLSSDGVRKALYPAVFTWIDNKVAL